MFTLLTTFVLEVLANATEQEREMTTQIGKEEMKLALFTSDLIAL